MIPGQVLCPAGHAHFPALAWRHADCAVVHKVVHAERGSSQTAVERPDQASPSVRESSPSRVVETAPRHGKYADPEARKAYRREWMRARRAKAKESQCLTHS